MTTPTRPSLRSSTFRAQLLVALDALRSEGLPTDDRLALAMVCLGDALRDRLSVPRTLFEAVSVSQGARLVLEDTSTEVASWQRSPLPSPSSGLVDQIVRRRDEAESLVVLARRVWQLRDDLEPPETVDSLIRLLREIDHRLSPLLTPSMVAAALVDRPLDDGWYRDFQGTDDRSDDGESAAATPAVDGHSVVPLVLAYISSGIGRRAVESWASASRDHGDDLVFAIDTALAAYEPVSFLARLWRRGHAPVSTVLRFRPVALAAADEPMVPSEQHTLGSLGPVEAEGTLEVTGRTVVLRVFEERPGAVSRVRLGDREASAPAPGQPWTVEHARRDGLRLRVEGPGGALDETLPMDDT